VDLLCTSLFASIVGILLAFFVSIGRNTRFWGLVSSSRATRSFVMGCRTFVVIWYDFSFFSKMGPITWLKVHSIVTLLVIWIKVEIVSKNVREKALLFATSMPKIKRFWNKVVFCCYYCLDLPWEKFFQVWVKGTFLPEGTDVLVISPNRWTFDFPELSSFKTSSICKQFSFTKI
jgi:hypothetical protein